MRGFPFCHSHWAIGTVGKALLEFYAVGMNDPRTDPAFRTDRAFRIDRAFQTDVSE